jgi:hypothetical protein
MGSGKGYGQGQGRETAFMETDFSFPGVFVGFQLDWEPIAFVRSRLLFPVFRFPFFPLLFFCRLQLLRC